MRALVLGIAMGLVVGTSALAQEDKSSANYMLPYCRAAANNQPPALTSDAIMQGMCVGIVDAIDFVLSEFPPDEKEFSGCPPTDVTLKQALEAVIKYIDATTGADA